jgi:hypothetical protein
MSRFEPVRREDNMDGGYSDFLSDSSHGKPGKTVCFFLNISRNIDEQTWLEKLPFFFASKFHILIWVWDFSMFFKWIWKEYRGGIPFCSDI